MKIKRECLVCGKKAVINVDDETRKYDKWHYFGEVELPVGRVRTSRLVNLTFGG